LEISSTSSAATEKIGASIGKRLKGGEVIELISDVGGGKTTLVRGLALGAGSQDQVSSPTFTISKPYQAANFTIHHLDLYRLGDNPGLIKHELQEVLAEATDVVVVEWAESLADMLPPDRVRVTIMHTGADQRTIKLEAQKALTYIIQDLQNNE
jgi:tRNA threonylcarbamoyladenosine biosynthesis protein TsaE